MALACPALLANAASAQTDEQFRKSFQDMFAGSCAAEQRKALPPNVQISDAAIQNYCSCFGSQIPTAITVQEMRQVAASGALTPELQSRLTAAGKSCIDRLKP